MKREVTEDDARLSRRLDEWLPAAAFRDVIAVRSRASSAQLMHALDEVTLNEMPLARFLGTIRYLPALFGPKPAGGARRSAHASPSSPRWSPTWDRSCSSARPPR